MISLRQSLVAIGKKPPLRIPGDVSMPCKSLLDTLTAWNKRHYDLLIITPQEFVEALKPLVDHKNSTGIPTMLITLEHIYQAYLGRDEAEKVKRCLALFQPNNGVIYAMLVGDEDKFPVRFIKWFDFNDKKAFQTWYVPVDFYYAALFKDKEDNCSFDDWDKNQDGYFGETPPFGPNVDNTGPINPDDVHSNPCLAVGRIPASTKEEVNVYVQKVITYEKQAFGKSWTKAALLVCGDWSDRTMDLNDIASNHLQGYNVHKLYLQGLGTEFPYPDNINKYMNPPEGVGFVAYVGHGNYNGWSIGKDANGNSFWYYNHLDGDPKRRGSLDDLINWDRLPIVFSIGCETGQFVTWPPLYPYRDVNGVDHKGTNNGEIFSSTPPKPACIQIKDFESMAEGMIVERGKRDSNGKIIGGTGAIAYIGTILGGWEGTYQALLKFFDAIPPIPSNGETLGEMWLNMLTNYLKDHKPLNPAQPANTVGEEIVYILQVWHLGLFGDPSLRIGGIPS